MNSTPVVTFGSWVEQAVVANGAVAGLASGAATGLNVTLNGERVNGIKETGYDGYCSNRVPLSFANTFSSTGLFSTDGCPGLEVTGLIGNANSTIDRASLVSYILGNEDSAGVIQTEPLTEGDNLVIGSRDATKVVTAGTTEVITASGTITIIGNIIYADESYTTLDNIPKLVIYADNINIDCNVTRVDAILIANNHIDTCPNSDGEKINEEPNA